MPTSVTILASIIAITFVSSKRLPVDWLTKMFRVRHHVVFEALRWLQIHNPIYADIQIDERQLMELPDDDMPEQLLAVVHQEEDDEMAEKEQESYVFSNGLNDEIEDDLRNFEEDGELFFEPQMLIYVVAY